MINGHLNLLAQPQAAIVVGSGVLLGIWWYSQNLIWRRRSWFWSVFWMIVVWQVQHYRRVGYDRLNFLVRHGEAKIIQRIIIPIHVWTFRDCGNNKLLHSVLVFIRRQLWVWFVRFDILCGVVHKMPNI
jgi:hypothetical protein